MPKFDEKEYHKKYYAANREKLHRQRQEWAARNRERVKKSQLESRKRRRDALKETSRAFYRANKEAKLAYQKAYRAANPEKVRKNARRYRKKLLREDINFRLRHQLACRVKDALKKGYKKAAKTESLLGADIPFVRAWLEAKFLPGMSWENYGTWHIDHIRPCASFDLTAPEQQKLCFHYSNLQPLWALDNLRKGSRL